MALENPSLTLSSGYKMPLLGLGTWKSKPNEVKNAVIEAVKAGYRHLDCAYVYGNEKEVGEALEELYKQNIISRKDIFITSKLWSTFHSPKLVKPALQETLANLKTDYLDLYLIHSPLSFKEGEDLFPKDQDNNAICVDIDYVITWRAMESLVDDKLVRSIGISNFNHEQTDRLLASCRIPPVTNQVECHPYLCQNKLINYCKSKGITVTAYSPLGSPDRPWATPEDPSLFEDERIVNIAKKYNKTPAQVLIRFHIDRDTIVIPKSVTKERIVENSKIFDFSLTKEDLETIESLDRHHRFCAFDWTKNDKYYPFNLEY